MNVHRVVALLNAPQSPFELACAAEVFGTALPDVPPRYSFRICAEHPGPLRTTVGYAMHVDSGLAALRDADTVVVPGWQPPGAPVPPTVTEALRAAHRRGARIVAVCTGAFVLAQAGLLDGRRATTHWRGTAQLAAAFPEVRVESDVLYVDHGDVATSAGTGAGIDLCLHLVRSDHGAAHAAQIARNMVLPPHREGSQLQYAAQPVPAKADESLAPLLEWATSRLDDS
ncbi:AraC family transcriptional activator FtrA [Streptomyces pseudovenezuelae]|uniref:AraC family transcriptional activator FtrA n=1 Tax=Streptomyces pseudovenezuelae TaxID=67350 RepID=A0ABT6L8Z1_9ACTN|nr:AraC family transcriptional activator FtrA [Streptomyces pseudovenezuelae]